MGRHRDGPCRGRPQARLALTETSNGAYRLLQVLDEDTDHHRVALALLHPGGAGLLRCGPDGVIDGFFFGAVRLRPASVRSGGKENKEAT